MKNRSVDIQLFEDMTKMLRSLIVLAEYMVKPSAEKEKLLDEARAILARAQKENYEPRGSAAPELLELLIEAEKAMVEDITPETRIDRAETIRLIRESIAKAKGEA